ncbi:MFS transporter [Alteribacillus sp. HJP-4]|uniref:MFS transporter n=1 Tax=Alteribacillus sp. HJP-4 TaxID=2775394 RepID=UPI0035CD2441
MSTIIGDWAQQFKTYNKNVRLFLIASILSNIGMGIYMIIYNYYIREIGFADDVNGRVIASQAAATAIALLPAGLLSDKIGRKKVILAGALFVGVSLAVMGPVSTSLVIAYGAYYGWAAVFTITCFLYLIGSIYFFLVFRNRG